MKLILWIQWSNNSSLLLSGSKFSSMMALFILRRNMRSYIRYFPMLAFVILFPYVMLFCINSSVACLYMVAMCCVYSWLFFIKV